MYFSVLAVGAVGAVVSRFHPKGMAWTMFASAAATVVVGLIALLLGRHEAAYSSVLEIMGLTGMFAALFTWSALLFRKAAPEERASDREVED